jgi:shikimate dehydrogenase
MAVTIRGTTRLLGVIGWPVAHSRSPLMQNAAIAAAGLDLAYVALPVPPQALAEALAGLRALGFLGANLTIPHKEAAMPYLAEATQEAQLAGAANTIRVEADGRLAGHNTDIEGITALLRIAGAELAGRRVLVLGCGGAGRAAAAACAREGAADVALLNRTRDRAEALAAAMAAAAPQVRWRPGSLDEIAREAPRAEVVLHMSSAGMKGTPPLALPWSAMDPSAVVFDAVYGVPATLASEAASRGFRAVGGLEMLLHQGAAAFRWWTGVEPDVGAMREALARA